MNITSSLLHQARRSWILLTMTVLLGFLGGILIVWQARMLSQVIARVFLEGWGLHQAAPLLRGLLVIFVIRAVLVTCSEFSAHQAASHIKSNLRKALFDHLRALGPAYTHSERSGELISLAQEGIEALEAYFSQYLPQVALAALVPLTVLFAVFPQDTLSGGVLLLTAPLIPLFMVLIGKGAEIATRQQFQALSRLSAHFLDSLQGLTQLKQLGRSRSHTRSIAEVGERYRRTTLSVLRITFLSALALELVATLSTAILAVEIGLRLLAGQLGFEQALFILVLAPEFYQPLRSLGLRFHAASGGIAAARRIFEVLELQPQLQDQPRSVALGRVAASRMSKSERPLSNIIFHEVGYIYPRDEEASLANLNFKIEAGQKVALVGASGAGKSTLANLLLRFIEPTQGQIRVNGRLLSSIPPAVWREQVAWIPQRPYLFHDTVAANLLLAQPNATPADLQAAARQAFLDEWIESLPAGFQTPIGEQGARLSVGLAQRLAMARAFLKNAPFLILDEPTSSQDPDLEDCLIHSIAHLMEGRTVLTIAHRLATVTQADQILVLAGGRIVQMGTHGELAQQPGPYMQMIRAQGSPG